MKEPVMKEPVMREPVMREQVMNVMAINDRGSTTTRTATWRRHTGRRGGFTVSELLVILVVLAVLVAALLPVMRRAHLDSAQAASAWNLQVISMAHVSYAMDFNDRQVTWVPDDLGLTAGNPQQYASTLGCPPSLILGFGDDGAVWGYFLPCGGIGVGTWGNIAVYAPLFWPDPGLGAHRVIGAKAFAAYIDGRYYSPLLYAPHDTITWESASAFFSIAAAFSADPTNPQVFPSSYALSPAAMWHPAVLSKNLETGLWWRNPNSFPLGYQSPSVAQCVHPELKTRTIEHNWNLGQPGPVNPAFAGGQTPYYFSHGLAAAPLTLFFDGRVEELSNAHVAHDDAIVLKATNGEVGLWTRDTPLGADGYFGAQSYDGFVTGHHVLTAGGILGRDILTVAPPRNLPRGGVAGHERRRRAGLGLPTRIAPPDHTAGLSVWE